MSIVHPRAQVDSNGFRVVVWRPGFAWWKRIPYSDSGPRKYMRTFTSGCPRIFRGLSLPGYYGHLHSIYVHYAAERGIPTMLMLVWMLGMIVFHCAKALRRVPGDGRHPFLLHGAIACVSPSWWKAFSS